MPNPPSPTAINRPRIRTAMTATTHVERIGLCGFLAWLSCWNVDTGPPRIMLTQMDAIAPNRHATSPRLESRLRTLHLRQRVDAKAVRSERRRTERCPIRAENTDQFAVGPAENTAAGSPERCSPLPKIAGRRVSSNDVFARRSPWTGWHPST